MASKKGSEPEAVPTAVAEGAEQKPKVGKAAGRAIGKAKAKRRKVRSKAEPNPTGRPSSFTPALEAELLSLLAQGKPIQPACERVGIDDSTFRKWRALARRGDKDKVAFFEKVSRARADGELHLWDVAREGDDKGVSNGPAKCAQWLLERTFSNRYAQRLNVKLEEGLELMLEDVERICGTKDCGCFEAILAALASRRDGGEAPGDAEGHEGAQVH